MRYQYLAALAAVVWGVTPALGAQSASESGPCRTGFSLEVTVQAVNAINSWPVGFKLNYKPEASRGIASRVQTKEWREFDSKQCGAWQKNNARLLEQVLAANAKPKRRSLVCRNVASINYKAGTKTERANVCLSSAKTDQVTADFQRFFTNGDGMVR